MSSAARSILVYSIYVFGLGAALLLVPNVPLPIFGLPQATEVWIRVAGMTVIFLAIFYFIAARNEYRQLFVASVAIRFSVPVFFAAFAGWLSGVPAAAALCRCFLVAIGVSTLPEPPLPARPRPLRAKHLLQPAKPGRTCREAHCHAPRDEPLLRSPRRWVGA